MYVSVYLGVDGFGNQMFKVAAMLGYAERHGHQPIFYEEPPVSKDHPSSALKIRDFFPHIPVRSDLAQEAWTILRESPELAMTYVDLPFVPHNVLLRGYFQSNRYFPSSGIPKQVPYFPRFSESLQLSGNNWSNTFFLHVRRGDYLHPSNRHHLIDLHPYISKSLPHFSESMTCFVVSDDIVWCKSVLPTWFQRLWFFCPAGLSDAETFFWMTLCQGGICGNSSFSWWAAHFQKFTRANLDTRVCMPFPWGSPALPEARDLIPCWANRIQWT